MFWKTIEVNYKEGFDEVVLVQKQRITGRLRVKRKEINE
jgi:hypothetical protein